MQALTIEEHIVYHIPARLHREREAIEGRMRVTNERILFDTILEGASPKQAIALEIRLTELKAISKRNTYLIFPNGLLFTLERGDTYKFEVAKRGRLAGYLNRRIRVLQRGTAGQ